MPKLYSLFGGAILLCIGACLHAQNITVINHYGDTTGLGNPSFVLGESEQHTLIINYYKPANSEQATSSPAAMASLIAAISI